MKLVTAEQMRQIEGLAIAAGQTAERLMERAGAAAAEFAWGWARLRLADSPPRHWLLLAGKGQNGGDAWAAARHLAELDAASPVTLLTTVPPAELAAAARAHAGRLPHRVAVRIATELAAADLPPGTVILDGLLGTGIRGTPRPPYDRLIAQVNASGRPVVALDLPSGLDADSGQGDCAVTADLTVTMGLPKRGLFTAAGRPRCGILRVADLGLATFADSALPAAAATPAQEAEAVLDADVAPLLGRRPQDAHKNRFGHLLILGGAPGYTGAPMLAGAAALRGGCGLVTVAVPPTIRPLLHPPLNALMLAAPDSPAELAPLLAKAQAAVAGPGAGRGELPRALLAAALAAPIPLVVDADGLRELAQAPQLLNRRPQDAPTILTPHPGEMRALLDGFGLTHLQDAPRERQATELARATGCFLILKGQASALAAPDGRLALNGSGTAGLATAGSGDVLAGLLGSLLAQAFTPWDALRAAAFLHGRAAELAPQGDRALVADDLPTLLAAAFRGLTPFP
ncbi:MAG: NAD(P)H-hydrate dehydratase [Lentisphaeria bacterium]